MNARRQRIVDHEAYAPRPPQIDTSEVIPVEGALFGFPGEEVEVEQSAPDTLAPLNTPVEWPSVNLADAALALADIMKGYNRRSRAEGVKAIRPTPGNRFNDRYKSWSDEVAGGTEVSAETAESKKSAALAVLGAKASMQAAFGDEVAQWYTNRVEDYLDRRYGPGSDALARANLVKRVDSIAKGGK